MPSIITRGAASARGFGNALSSLVPEITDPVLGDFYKGGYYLGLINIGSDVYRLIISPKPQTSFGGILITGGGGTVPTLTTNDGKFNTDTLAPISLLCSSAKQLSINGYTDWYVPSRDELEMMYRYMKPAAGDNFVGARSNARGEVGVIANGVNQFSIPTGNAYTTTSPAQIPLTNFQTGGAQAIESGVYDVVLSSTVGADLWAGVPAALCTIWANGQQTIANPQSAFATRAMRRELYIPPP